MSPAISIESLNFSPLQGQDLQHVERDFSKIFLQEIKENPPDVLIVDFFSDARFDCLTIGHSFVTNNEWKLWKTSMYQSVKNNLVVGANTHQDDFVPLFAEAVNQFKLFYDEHLQGVELIVNRARGVFECDDGDGKVGYYNKQLVARLNDNWALLEGVFIEKLAPKIISPMLPSLKGDAKHPWGGGYVHYTKDYYHGFFDQLVKLLG